MAASAQDASPKTSPGFGGDSADAATGAGQPGFRYEYMFAKDKSPTKQLDAILRAVARYISLEIGEKKQAHLTPQKLAAFYKAVGGDYDALFVQRDNTSISWIWQVIGCQHSLQPTDNDFEAPCIPALTYRGFSRWESLEVLLGPEEHVPFLQYAVKNWNLKHPDTHEPFPPDLPRHVFPSEPDDDVDRWHQTCASRLWWSATSQDQPPGPGAEADGPATSKPTSPADQPGPRYAYVHVKPSSQPPPQPSARPHPRSSHGQRPFSYVHVAGRHAPYPAQRPPAWPPAKDHVEPPTHEERGRRRRSFSDYPWPGSDGSPPPQPYPSPPGPRFRSPPRGRPHSHPRRFSTDSSDDDVGAAARFGSRATHSPPVPLSSRRYAPPSAPQPPPAAGGGGGVRPQRPDHRSSELKRRANNSPLGSLREKVTGKVSELLNGGRPTDRPSKADSPRTAYVDAPPRLRRSPQQVPPPSRMAHVYTDVDSDEMSDSGLSDDGLQGPQRRPRVRDPPGSRVAFRERGRPSYVLDSRDPDTDADGGLRRHRSYLRRPEPQRRTSSHADIDRRRDLPLFDPRDRDRFRPERRRVERHSPDGRASVSPMAAGGSGRRYPDAVYT